MSWIDSDEHLGDIVLTEEQIHERVHELGAQITKDYAGRSPLLIGVLKGAFVFITDLARSIDLPVSVDFMAVSSYGSATKTSGVVRIIKDLDIDLTDQDVIVVEDIVESGLTLNYLVRNLRSRKPQSLAICTLLRKEGEQHSAIQVDYVGFAIPPTFVVGYGLDTAERYRNLPFISNYRV
ncbi:MAG: hypoxanthine phosphoribosyltransferase [Ferrimicrobium sp.]